MNLYVEVDVPELDQLIKMMSGTLTLQEIAEELGLNYRTLYRRFLKCTGFKAHNFEK